MKALAGSAVRAFLVAWVVLLAGCASTGRVGESAQIGSDHWQGRLAVKLLHPEVRSFSALFDLQGNATAGQLTLSTPLGTTLARMDWMPDSAVLTSTGEPRRFGSMEALALDATGVDIPVTQLFSWFKGQSATAPQWDADLRDFASGRITARRTGADLQAELRIVFEH